VVSSSGVGWLALLGTVRLFASSHTKFGNGANGVHAVTVIHTIDKEIPKDAARVWPLHIVMWQKIRPEYNVL